MHLLNNNKNKTIGFISRQTDIYLLFRPNSIPIPLYSPLSNEVQNKLNTLNKIKFFNIRHLSPKDTVFRRPQPFHLTINGLHTAYQKKYVFSNFF